MNDQLVSSLPLYYGCCGNQSYWGSMHSPLPTPVSLAILNGVCARFNLGLCLGQEHNRPSWLGRCTEVKEVPAPLASALLACTSIWNPFREMEESAVTIGVAIGAKSQIVGQGNV